MQRTRRWLLLAIAMFGFGCGGGDSTSPNASIAGSYTLRTVNGANLPFIVLQVGADKVEIVSETIVIADGGTFTQQGVIRTTTNGTPTTTSYADAGSYTRNGTAVSFVFNSDGSSGTGTVADGTITVGIDGFSLVYRK